MLNAECGVAECGKSAERSIEIESTCNGRDFSVGDDHGPFRVIAVCVDAVFVGTFAVCIVPDVPPVVVGVFQNGVAENPPDFGGRHAGADGPELGVRESLGPFRAAEDQFVEEVFLSGALVGAERFSEKPAENGEREEKQERVFHRRFHLGFPFFADFV